MSTSGKPNCAPVEATMISEQPTSPIPVPRQKLAQEIFCNFNKKEKRNLIENSSYKEIERERIVDVNINRLRKKIEKNPKSPRYLKTVRSIGYMLVPD